MYSYFIACSLLSEVRSTCEVDLYLANSSLKKLDSNYVGASGLMWCEYFVKRKLRIWLKTV